MPDKFKEITDAIRKLARREVVIGIPGEGAPRADGTFDNVSRGYVFELGSPAINMPPRPHLVPGVRAAESEIIDRMTAAAKAALAGNSDQAEKHLAEAGDAGVNSVQQMITAKLKPEIKPESYLKRVTGRRARRQRARRGGLSVIELARAEAPTATPLVDTAAYRRAITRVVRDRK